MKRTDADTSLVRRALGGHAAIGLLAGAILYLVALTGTLAVIHDQWTRWEQPRITEIATLTPAAAQRALATGFARGGLAGRPTATLMLQWPSADLPRAVVTTDRGSWYVDADGTLLDRKEDPFSTFVVDLHEALNLPATWGLILVGAMGVALAALTLTGIMAHPRILRDAFRLRARHEAGIARVDWHNRLGVWTAPFVLAVALTGAFLGLSGVGTTLMARLYAGGDVQRIYAPVFGSFPVASGAPAALADTAAGLRSLAERAPAVSPTYVIVRAPGTSAQDIQIIARHERRLIYGEAYIFDARGEWKGPTGMAEGSIGQQVAASTYNLHFGNFGGPLVEVAYLLLGLALCGVTATGTTIWLRKRQRRGLRSERLVACWTMVVWGMPLLLAACAGLCLVATGVPLPMVFWVLLALGLVAATISPGWLARQRPERWLAAAVATLGLVHLVVLRPMTGWPIAIDLVAMAPGVMVLLRVRTGRARQVQ